MEDRTYYVNTKEDLKLCMNNLNYFILKFTATWCTPCKIVQPLFNELFENLPSEYAYIEIDMDEGKSIANAFRIKNVPTFIHMVKGQGEELTVGSDQDKLIRFFENVVKTYNSQK